MSQFPGRHLKMVLTPPPSPVAAPPPLSRILGKARKAHSQTGEERGIRGRGEGPTGGSSAEVTSQRVCPISEAPLIHPRLDIGIPTG